MMQYFAIMQAKNEQQTKGDIMIIIPDDLWYIRGYKRTVGNTNAKLAYMCAAEYTKSGDDSAALFASTILKLSATANLADCAVSALTMFTSLYVLPQRCPASMIFCTLSPYIVTGKQIGRAHV